MFHPDRSRIATAIATPWRPQSALQAEGELRYNRSWSCSLSPMLPAMPQPFRTSRRVEFRDTDAAGIVHFSVFPVYMEQAEHELLRSLGMSVHHRDADGEISWPRVSVGCDYLAALRFEDLVDIEVTLARLGSKSVRWEFAFSCQGRPVARGQMTVVCCRIHRDRPPESIPIPAPIAEKLQALVE